MGLPAAPISSVRIVLPPTVSTDRLFRPEHRFSPTFSPHSRALWCRGFSQTRLFAGMRFIVGVNPEGNTNYQLAHGATGVVVLCFDNSGIDFDLTNTETPALKKCV